MKKLFFAMGAFVALSFAACGNMTDAAGVNDSDSVAVDSLVEEVVEFVDTLEVDTTLAD